jgi:hypothetical protein
MIPRLILGAAALVCGCASATQWSPRVKKPEHKLETIGIATHAPVGRALALSSASAGLHSRGSGSSSCMTRRQQQHPYHTLLQDPEIKLEVNSSVLRQSGEWFEVTWRGVPEPSYMDWVALWVPADANITETAPAKWVLPLADTLWLPLPGRRRRRRRRQRPAATTITTQHPTNGRWRAPSQCAGTSWRPKTPATSSPAVGGCASG